MTKLLKNLKRVSPGYAIPDDDTNDQPNEKINSYAVSLVRNIGEVLTFFVSK